MTHAADGPGALNAGFVFRERVQPEDAGRTVLEHHVRRHAQAGAATWRERIEGGLVRVDGVVAACDRVLRAGEEIAVLRPPWSEPEAPSTFGVLFEDEHVLVADKPSGLQVLPAGPFLERTLLALVRGSGAGREEAAPIHRLGRGTSGAILIGKSELARRELSRQLREGRLGKIYLALVAPGQALPASFVATEPIGPVDTARGRIHAASAGGRAARTRGRVLRALGGDRALVAAWPITGRPDQIRIHLAFLGAAICGDPLFLAGGTLASARPGDGGYLLHSAGLRFRHPASGRVVRVRSRPPWLP